MGVYLLEEYMFRYAPEACNEVDIKTLISEYKATCNSPPEFIIDSAIFLEAASKYTPWLYGGSMVEMDLVIQSFIRSFHKCGAKVTFFLDYTVSKNKLRAWVINEKKKFAKVENLFETMSNDDVEVHPSRYFKDESTIPANLTYLFQHTITKLGGKLIECKFDVGWEMSKYARINNCFAIMAQNSNFVITNAAKYLSLRYCDFINLKTISYDSNALAKNLKLSINYFPLFAAIAGNNDLDAGIKLSRHHDKVGAFNNTKTHFKNLSAYIQQFPSRKEELTKTLPKVATDIFSDESVSSLIEECLAEYIMGKRKDLSLLNEDIEPWQRLLEFCRSFAEKNRGYYELYTIMSEHQWLAGAQIEDFSMDASGKVNLSLRRKLLGILLYEAPEDIQFQELIFTGRSSLTIAKIIQPIFPVDHPGIEELWRGRGEEISNIRWNLICTVFNIFSPDEIKEIPTSVLVPLLSLRYLVKERRRIFEEWELNALLASAICLRDYTPKDLKEIPFLPLQIRAVNVYTIVTNVYNVVIKILLAVGLHKLEEISPKNYQEGKLFHLKYNIAKKVPSYELFGFSDFHLNLFVDMKKVINQKN